MAFRVGLLAIAAGLFSIFPAAANAACVGSIGPGGPCSIGPGGGLSIGPGGGRSIGPGGGLSIGPGGGQSIGPGGGLSIGPGGGLSIGPGGGKSIGPGGGESIGPGGGRSIGPDNRWIDVPNGGRWKLGSVSEVPLASLCNLIFPKSQRPPTQSGSGQGGQRQGCGSFAHASE
jgi:hypothetical protein